MKKIGEVWRSKIVKCLECANYNLLNGNYKLFIIGWV